MFGSIAMLLVNGCGSDSEAVCVSNDVAEVCARSDGGITFSGDGLEPGSEVQMIGPEDQAFTIEVGPDGSFEPEPGNIGVIAGAADAELTFAVSAIDGNGDVLEGDMTVTN
jgi:hypothetical protein